MPEGPEKPTKKLDRARTKALLRDAGQIIWGSRRRLLIGIPLLLVNRLSSIVTPYLTKFIFDDVLTQHHYELLWRYATWAALAAALGSVTDYSLAQLLGMAAQRSITQLRMKIQQHVQRLPIGYFDATKTGVLVSRVMNDAEGIRNLVGTGLVQLFGGLLTSIIGIVVLFHFSPRLASIILGMILVFAIVVHYAFKTVRPIFRKRAELNAQITGRLNENFSGIRVVKAYRAEGHESRVFAKSAHELFRN